MRIKLLPCIISSVLLLSGCSSSEKKEKDKESIEQVTSSSETVTTPVQTVPVTSAAPVISTAPVTSTSPVAVKKPENDKRERPFENFPITDGSTSTISLDANICAAFLGISYEEAEKTVVHTKTHKSFDNLIAGEVEAIYTVPLSDEQKQKAADNNVTLEKVPAAREGFVFIVNADNPVDSLTQDQIRMIYSGEITNWNEVGGNDAEIRVFHRNKDSGSYNYMTEFMGDYELCESKEQFYESTSMDGIMHSVADFDSGIDSIGFSVYSFATDKRFDNIKFIAVDSVQPTSETLNDGSYPISSYSYFMYRADEPEDSPVRKLAEFIQSEEGQDAVERAGLIRTDGKKKGLYVSENDLYTQTGTGHPKPDNLTSPKGFYYNKDINKITDAQAYQMVREFIKQSESELNGMIGSIPVTDLPIDLPYNEDRLKVFSNIYCINNYCTAVVELCYNNNCVDLRIGYFDLAEHKQIELSDFFYEGVNFMEYINDAVKNDLSRAHYGTASHDVDHFIGLSENCLFVNPCSLGAQIYIPYRNPYIDKECITLYMDGYWKILNMLSSYADTDDHEPIADCGILAYEFADKSVIFEECDVSDLYRDLFYLEYQDAFYSATHGISKGFVKYPVKSRVLNDDQLRALQKAIIECAEIVADEEIEYADNQGHHYSELYVDIVFEQNENRFLLIPKPGRFSDTKYYLDIYTLEFYRE